MHSLPKFRAALGVLPFALGSLGLAMPAQAQPAPAPAAAPAPATSGYVKETAANLPGYNIYRPADLAARKGPVPVISWANGACARYDTIWSSIAQRWAASGFVVITIHDAAAAAQLEAARARMAQDAAAGRPEPPRDATGAPAGARPPGAASQNAATVDAQGKAVDWAVAENARAGSPYAGKLDLTRIAAAGNSCGGISSLALAGRDKRMKSVFILSGSSVGPTQTREQAAPIMAKVAVPTMWVVGGTEDLARPAADMDYSLLPGATPAVVVYRASGDHRTVSTTPTIQADAAQMGVLWFKATLQGDRAAAATLTSTICAQCDAKTWTVKAKHFAGAR